MRAGFSVHVAFNADELARLRAARKPEMAEAQSFCECTFVFEAIPKVGSELARQTDSRYSGPIVLIAHVPWLESS